MSTTDDLAALAAAAPEHSGLDFLRAVRDGRLPRAPIQGLLGFALVEVDEGRVVFTLTPAEEHYNPIGTVHGGVAATLLDSATGAAVHTTLPRGGAYATLQMTYNLVRPITATTGEVRAEGRVVHGGSRVATSSGELTRASDGALLAHATATCLILGG